jgi:hypothetical protein
MVDTKFQAGNSGGNPKGRPRGTPNKISHDIKAACQRMGPDLIEGLKDLAFNSRSEAIRLAATEQLLSRGYGKPAQAITGADDGPVEVKHIISWIKDDKPEAPVSKEQLTGAAHAEDLSWH